MVAYLWWSSDKHTFAGSVEFAFKLESKTKNTCAMLCPVKTPRWKKFWKALAKPKVLPKLKKKKFKHYQ